MGQCRYYFLHKRGTHQTYASHKDERLFRTLRILFPRTNDPIASHAAGVVASAHAAHIKRFFRVRFVVCVQSTKIHHCKRAWISQPLLQVLLFPPHTPQKSYTTHGPVVVIVDVADVDAAAAVEAAAVDAAAVEAAEVEAAEVEIAEAEAAEVESAEVEAARVEAAEVEEAAVDVAAVDAAAVEVAEVDAAEVDAKAVAVEAANVEAA